MFGNKDKLTYVTLYSTLSVNSLRKLHLDELRVHANVTVLERGLDVLATKTFCMIGQDSLISSDLSGIEEVNLADFVDSQHCSSY
jgi:hypothetical protein